MELNEILLQEWRERRYASIKQPTIIQANLFGKLEIISATDVLKDDSFTNESGYVLLTFLLLNRKREHPAAAYRRHMGKYRHGKSVQFD